MTKLVTLKLTGNLDDVGFQVSLEISKDGDRPSIEETGQLPAAPELLTQLETHWLEKYRPLSAPYRIKSKGIEYSGSIQTRLKDCQESGKTLRDRLNEWLDAESFRDIDRLLRQQLKPDDDIRVLIRTNDSRLHKLPWHLWSFCQSYPNTEIALSPPKFQRRERFSSTGGRQKIRILAILGHRGDIDVEGDRQTLNNLPGAEVEFLDQPTRSKINDELWDQPWDIIFFAGHSETEGDEGRIHINPTESLTIDELWYALRKAVNQGLQVAIFNSCDGLGLARRLDDLQIPITIVMRELIPDQVAHAFLTHFLEGFAEGKPFYRAVREARERLQGMENEFPCASWLPVVCQHPWEDPPTWQGLLTPLTPRPSKASPWWQGLGTVLVASVLVTSLVMGVRSLGWLEQSELNAYDHLLRSRPAETMDERLLLVEITDEDIESQPVSERGEASLSDRTLEELLETLQRYEPNVIGLRLIRDQEAETEQLASLLQSPNFFAGCVHEVYDTTNPNKPVRLKNGELPPPETSQNHLGFFNLPRVQENINRRHYYSALSRFTDCPTEDSLDFRLARHYLSTRGIEIELKHKERTQNFGDRSFRVLQSQSAAYHNLNDGGYQIMLNYRVHPEPFHTLHVSEILDKDFDPSWIRDKIILIGTNTTGRDKNHDVPTPYSQQRRVSSLEVRGHMVSQIISAALDDRPIIWWWSNPVEVFWILLWSIIGGLLPLGWHSPLRLGGFISLSLVLLYGICWILFLQGGWIPLIPPALALMVTSFTIVVILSRHQENNSAT